MRNRDIILALMTTLAKRIVTDEQPERSWDEFAASTQGTYLELACKEAGLDYDDVVERMKQEIIREASQR